MPIQEVGSSEVADGEDVCRSCLGTERGGINTLDLQKVLVPSAEAAVHTD